MKKVLFTGVAALAAASALHASTVSAEEVGISTTVDYVSKYVFRGVQLAEGAIQPGVEVSYGGLYGGVWHSAPLTEEDFYGDETDWYVGYGFALSDTIAADVGVTRYDYDGGGSDTTEVFAGASFDTALSPSAYVYYDIDLEAVTLEGSLGHSIAVSETTSIDLSGAIGLVDADSFDYEYGSVGASYNVALSEQVAGYVGVSYATNSSDGNFFTVDNGVVEDIEDSGAWFSIGISFSN